MSCTHTYVCVTTTKTISLTFDSLTACGTASWSCNYMFKTRWTELRHFSRQKHSESGKLFSPRAFSWIKIKTQFISNPPRNKAFWNLDQIPLVISCIWNILHSPHHSTHTRQHADQTLSQRLPLLWILSMDALLPILPNIRTLISHNDCPVSATGWWLYTGTKPFMPHSSVASHVLCQGLDELTPGQ